MNPCLFPISRVSLPAHLPQLHGTFNDSTLAEFSDGNTHTQGAGMQHFDAVAVMVSFPLDLDLC